MCGDCGRSVFLALRGTGHTLLSSLSAMVSMDPKLIPPQFTPGVASDQETQFARAFQVLSGGVAAGAFPGACAAITLGGKLVALKAVGRFTYEAASPAVTTATIFDLASVSKVVATTAAAMILYEHGELDLDLPLAAVTPEFARASDDARRTDVSVRMLLAHSSGLPAYARLFERARTRADLL